MAKNQTGFNKDGMGVLVWEIFRGTGRQTGRTISKALTKELSKRTLNSDSKFRKAMNRFEITSTLKGSLSKMYKIIDLFYEEYTTTKAILQRSTYLKDDVTLIESKLEHIERLIYTESEERAYDRCVEFWYEIKEKVVGTNE